MDPTLHTKRLALLRPVPEDLDDMLRIFSDRRSTPAGAAEALTWREEAEGVFQRWDRHWEQHAAGRYTVRLRGGDRVIGFAGVDRILGTAGRSCSCPACSNTGPGAGATGTKPLPQS